MFELVFFFNPCLNPLCFSKLFFENRKTTRRVRYEEGGATGSLDVAMIVDATQDMDEPAFKFSGTIGELRMGAVTVSDVVVEFEVAKDGNVKGLIEGTMMAGYGEHRVETSTAWWRCASELSDPPLQIRDGGSRFALRPGVCPRRSKRLACGAGGMAISRLPAV